MSGFEVYPETSWYFYKEGMDNLGIFNDSPPLKISLGSAANPGIMLGDTLYISPTNTNTLNSGYSSAADSGAPGSDIWINYRGYLDGFTHFRDFRIGDGKGNLLFVMNGSTQNATFTGQVTASLFNGSAAGLTGLTSTQVFNAVSLASNPDWYRSDNGFYITTAGTGIYAPGGQLTVYNNGSLVVNNTAQATQFRCDATYNSAATAQVDFSNQATSFSLVASGTTTLPVGAGVLIICDTSTTGQTAIYILGGGTLSVLSSSTAFVVSATPSSATGISWNGSAYVIKNGNLATRTYHMAFLKIRAAN